MQNQARLQPDRDLVSWTWSGESLDPAQEPHRCAFGVMMLSLENWEGQSLTQNVVQVKIRFCAVEFARSQNPPILKHFCSVLLRPSSFIIMNIIFVRLATWLL
jgi:hypothetical protein